MQEWCHGEKTWLEWEISPSWSATVKPGFAGARPSRLPFDVTCITSLQESHIRGAASAEGRNEKRRVYRYHRGHPGHRVFDLQTMDCGDKEGLWAYVVHHRCAQNCFQFLSEVSSSFFHDPDLLKILEAAVLCDWFARRQILLRMCSPTIVLPHRTICVLRLSTISLTNCLSMGSR